MPSKCADIEYTIIRMCMGVQRRKGSAMCKQCNIRDETSFKNLKEEKKHTERKK